jgi:RimJ/RimL family protein N-acetyltransferase
MMDLKNYAVEETLKNGLRVTIRAIRETDRDELLAVLQELDDQSIYRRFFSLKKHFSEKELKAATEVDFDRVMALVACLPEKEGDRLIGGCRYVVFEHPETAEVAFTVRKGYHGLGLGSLMFRRLSGIAKDKGIKELCAEVLSENTPMLKVFKRGGFPIKFKQESGVTHVIMSLAGND